MPKKIDPIPISVERSRTSMRYELILNADGTLKEILAHRFLVTVNTANGNSQTSTPEYIGIIRITAASVPVAVKNRIADIEGLVDGLDQ